MLDRYLRDIRRTSETTLIPNSPLHHYLSHPLEFDGKSEAYPFIFELPTYLSLRSTQLLNWLGVSTFKTADEIR